MELQGTPLAADARHQYDAQHAPILSLDQIQALRSSNEYTEGPSVVRRPPAPCLAPRSHDKQERTHEVIRFTNNNNNEHRPHHHHHHAAGAPRAPGLSRSTSTGSAASSGSGGSGSSEQGLLARSPPPRPIATQPRPVRTQPKAKGLLLLPPPAPEAPLNKPGQGKGPAEPLGPHQLICERCAKCKCGECTAPRSLPSCLACGGQCLCSPESALEHGTCMCLVRGAFYHCSNDDQGDSCADQPCSLSRSHCRGRFLCMGALSLVLPCLLCYPPVKGCLKAGQSCHDRLTRPGCRCKNSNTVYCKLEPWASRSPDKPSCSPPPPPPPGNGPVVGGPRAGGHMFECTCVPTCADVYLRADLCVWVGSRACVWVHVRVPETPAVDGGGGRRRQTQREELHKRKPL